MGKENKIRFYQASSSELYGKVETPQTELTLYESPYAVAKMFAYWIVVNYRNHMEFMRTTAFCCHESPRRGKHLLQEDNKGLANFLRSGGLFVHG